MALSTRDKRMLSAVAQTMKLLIEPDASFCCLGQRWDAGVEGKVVVP
jgi:hypothetical protein